MNVNLIEIPQDLPGFNQFIGTWVCQGSKNLLVDVGPAASAHRLIAELDRRSIDRIDYILITHIHIDHAGALADVLTRFPMARVVCHEKAIPLLIDPSKIWAGSLSLLGETARMYGKPKPVPKNRVISHTRCPIRDMQVIETSGHAAHHLSFSSDGRLFVGEAGGNFAALSGGTYLRPATPPRFFMEAFLASLKRLLSLENQTLCYGHFGEVENSREMLERFLAQLLRWREILLAELKQEEAASPPALIRTLLEKDPDLKLFHKMPPVVQHRERFFLTNSINGYVEFLREWHSF